MNEDPFKAMRESFGAQRVESSETTTTTCRKCDVQFTATPFEFFNEWFLPKMCPGCVEKEKAEEEARQAATKQAERDKQWQAICPPLYQDTDLSHPDLSPVAVKCIGRWDMKRGLGFVGDSGKGKTRLLFLALKRAHDAGKWVRVISHNKFSKLVIDAFMGENRTDGAKTLEALRKTGFLMIDDLGKAPSTERADAEMEELVEYRVSNDLPILWSANAGGGWLENRFGPDRGPALVRRLAQFCECVTV